jgi:hypothetical protein
MDRVYADTVRLLLSVAPDVFAGGDLAMKGGTAINLFVREMPRLSVDIDVAFTRWGLPRRDALAEIAARIGEIERTLTRRGLSVRTIDGTGEGDSKVLINDGAVQVKVEVNRVFRGVLLPVEFRPLVPNTAAMFSVELEAPVLAVDELYGSKLVAAMDRQHPRDLFDVWQAYEAGGISDGAVECFVTYLAGHHRPTHEVLFARPKEIAIEFARGFVGLTKEPVNLSTLLEVRQRLFADLPGRLTERQRRFLVGLTRAEPDWALLRCGHAAELPALRWKLQNLLKFRQKQPAAFERQARELESMLA